MKLNNIIYLILFILIWFGSNLLFGLDKYRTLTFIDDHTLIPYFDNLYYLPFVEQIKTVFLQVDRFRPLMNIHKILFLRALGLNINYIQIYFLVLAVITSFNFYKIFNANKIDKIRSFALSILLLMGMQGVIWWVYDSSENIGMFFLSFTLLIYEYTIKNKKNNIFFQILYAFCLILVSFSKESFIFFIPFLIYWTWEYPFIRYFSILLLLAELTFIKLFVHSTNGYAGVDNQTFSLWNLAKVFVQYSIRGYGIPLYLTIALLFWQKKLTFFQFFDKYQREIIGLILGVCPFILIYTKSGINVGRYLLPLLFCQLLFGYKLYQQLNKKVIVLYVVLAIFGYHLVKFYQIQSAFVLDNIKTESYLTAIKSKLPHEAKIVLIADPKVDGEKSEALIKYLKSQNACYKKNVTIQLFDIAENKAINESYMQYYANYYTISYLNNPAKGTYYLFLNKNTRTLFESQFAKFPRNHTEDYSIAYFY